MTTATWHKESGVDFEALASGRQAVAFKRGHGGSVHCRMCDPNLAESDTILLGCDENGYFIIDCFKDLFRAFVNDRLIREDGKTYLPPEQSNVHIRVGSQWFDVDLQQKELRHYTGNGVAVRCTGVTLEVNKDRKRLLDNVEFDVQCNEFAALIGPSGCGKSTLLRVIAGFYKHTSGRIDFSTDGGHHEHPVRERSKQVRIGYVPQGDCLPETLSVAELFQLRVQQRGCRRPPSREIEEALDSVGLAHRQQSRVGVLSGGERRRLYTALEMYFKPALLLMDEPFAGLDPESERQMLNVLRHLRGSSTIICSTHQFAAPDVFDQVIALRNGKTFFQGYVYCQNGELIVRSCCKNQMDRKWLSVISDIYAKN